MKKKLTLFLTLALLLLSLPAYAFNVRFEIDSLLEAKKAQLGNENILSGNILDNAGTTESD